MYRTEQQFLFISPETDTCSKLVKLVSVPAGAGEEDREPALKRSLSLNVLAWLLGSGPVHYSQLESKSYLYDFESQYFHE